jgi:RNA polymerase sigma-70 factor (ECF subfamily)
LKVMDDGSTSPASDARRRWAEGRRRGRDRARDQAPSDTGCVPEPDDQLFARIYPDLLRFAAVVAPAEVGPEDLLQEALVRTLRNGPLHRLDSPEAYLRRALVNLAANERRRLGRSRRARNRLGATTEEAEMESYPSDVSDLLRLPVESRAVVWLADIEGWPFDQIGAVVGCSAETARARASRARAALRHLYAIEHQEQGT